QGKKPTSLPIEHTGPVEWWRYERHVRASPAAVAAARPAGARVGAPAAHPAGPEALRRAAAPRRLAELAHPRPGQEPLLRDRLDGVRAARALGGPPARRHPDRPGPAGDAAH